MPEGTSVEIRPAKGRPMLTWVGKRPLRHVTAFPAQLVETYAPVSAPDLTGLRKPVRSGAGGEGAWAGWPAGYPPAGLLFHGDNKEVLAHLLANGFRGKVKLIYIDPPFDSGADYVRRVNLRGVTGTARLDGESYTLGEQIQYTDIWANDNYLQFMYERLLLLRELLADEGFIFVHLDSNRVHYIRVLLDEALGEGAYLNEIIWQQTSAHNDPGQFGRVHNNILLYGKSGTGELTTKLGTRSQSYIEGWFRYALGPSGDVISIGKGQAVPPGYRRFRLSDLRSPHPRPNLMYLYKGYHPHPNGWAVTLERMQEYDRQNRLHFPSTPDGRIQLRNFLEDMDAPTLQDMWWDLVAESGDEGVLAAEAVTDTWRAVRTLQGNSSESRNYPTQKPEALLQRIVEVASSPGGLVLDCFIGSGTTAAVAQKLGRRWIGCDINKGAIQTTSKRLQAIITEQVAAAQAGAQARLPLPGQEPEDEGEPGPAQLSFAVYRVNDYDLQIQHNEAANLACEHIGITRTRNDPFFDGTLGRSLVKIVPFTHPLSVLDLEEVRRELGARPEEERDVTVVCLGKELAADAWLEEWNRLRTKTQLPNRIAAIELRTDPRYGRFFVHQPAWAKVTIERHGGKIRVKIEEFISPTIIERLKEQAGVLSPQIEDWRAMVDSVMIDPAYDGQVFHVALADVPERKSDLVAGEYELEEPAGETTVAVKITDMLGEEVVVTERV